MAAMRSTGPTRPPDDFPWLRHDDDDGPPPVALSTVAAWHDLLGFSQMLDKAKWQLDSPDAALLIARLKCLVTWLQDAAFGGGEQLVVNDGAINTFSPLAYEGSLGSRWDLVTWLHSRLKVHCVTTGLEYDWGLPGLRTIICEGQIVAHHRFLDQADERQRGTYFPLSTQLNTALSKCFIADQAGSSAGLKRGCVYLETSFIDTLVNRFGCKRYGVEYLFLSGKPLLEDVSRYSQTLPFFELPHQYVEADMLRDRSAWIRLGPETTIEYRNLKISLTEVDCYSPTDESALFWFDTLTGDQHGFSDGHVHQVNEDGTPRYVSPELGEAEVSLLTDYFSALIAFVKANQAFPDEVEIPSPQPIVQRVGISGESSVYIKSPSGLFVPAQSRGFLPPAGHPWGRRLLTGDELRKAVKVTSRESEAVPNEDLQPDEDRD